MPKQVYRCPVEEHGEFEHEVSIKDDVPAWKRCPVLGCGRKSLWVPQAIPTIWKCAK